MSDDDPFWTGLADGTLRLPHCRACDRVFFPPGPVCPHCHETDSTWTSVDPTGDLHAYTRQHRTAPGVPEPIVVGLVALDAGPRVLARIDATYGELAIGQRVRVVPWAYDEGLDRGARAEAPFFRVEPAG